MRLESFTTLSGKGRMTTGAALGEAASRSGRYAAGRLLLAAREASRPNPIGVTTVPVVKVSGQSLFVRGLDAIDATPVLDIKPPAFDAPSQPRVPEWLDRLMLGYF